jgi:hypothetical protein
VVMLMEIYTTKICNELLISITSWRDKSASGRTRTYHWTPQVHLLNVFQLKHDYG